MARKPTDKLMGRLNDKAKARKEGVTDRAIRKRRAAARVKAVVQPPLMAMEPGEEADIRWRNARAATAEDRLKLSRGELVQRPRVVAEAARTMAECKARVLAIPDHAAVRLGLGSEDQEVLRGMCVDALAELSTQWT